MANTKIQSYIRTAITIIKNGSSGTNINNSNLNPASTQERLWKEILIALKNKF